MKRDYLAEAVTAWDEYVRASVRMRTAIRQAARQGYTARVIARKTGAQLTRVLKVLSS